jgi:hypothetical protein
MPGPLVSVVMPVRDGEVFLEEAIASIRAQTLRDLEILVVDDGSRDGTMAILRRHAAEDPRLRIIAQPPSGIAVALNRGIGEATAPLIARMDADDIAKPHRLAAQLEALNRHPAVAALGSAYEVIDRSGRVRRRVQLPTSPSEISKLLETSNCIAHPTVVMRREAVTAVGGYRQAFLKCEDYDLWLRLDEKAELLNLEEPLLLYREHSGQETWWNVEQRILSELGAKQLALRRRSGLADPTESGEPIARERLRALGLADATISEQIVVRALATAAEARAASDPRAAWAAFRLALRQRRLSMLETARFWRACAGALAGRVVDSD